MGFINLVMLYKYVALNQIKKRLSGLRRIWLCLWK